MVSAKSSLYCMDSCNYYATNNMILFPMAIIGTFLTGIGLQLNFDGCGVGIVSLRASMNWLPLDGVSHV